MKRLLTLILALMLVVSLAACNKSPSPSVSASPVGSPSPQNSTSPDSSPSPQDFQTLPSGALTVDEDNPWGDPSFEKIMRAALDVPEGEVDVEVTSAIKKLSIMPQDGKVEVKIDDNPPVLVEVDEPVRAIEDLLRFSGLTEFELGYAELETTYILVMAAMAMGIELESLSLVNAGIEDVSHLAFLTTLKTVNLSGNKITDISPLMDLPALEKLDVSGNPLADPAQADKFEGVEVTY